LDPAQAGPFLGRLLRLDDKALVRLRPAGAQHTELWGRVPWDVLVTRRVTGSVPADITVPAGALFDLICAGDAGLPPARDEQWRGPLPPSAGTVVESVPVAELVRLGAAAAQTMREARGRVGERVLRDTLLDHVAIVVSIEPSAEPAIEPSGEPAAGSPAAAGVARPVRVEVRQRLVQAALRMAMVTETDVGEFTVRTAGGWVGLASRSSAVWQQIGASLAVSIVR
jgi:hypothetical protein